MSKRPLHVAISPLTGTIFAGHVLKGGGVWAANKQDVTIEALVAVAQHVEKFGAPVVISRENGTPEYEITVKRLSDDDTLNLVSASIGVESE